jgi:hypothetical protein
MIGSTGSETGGVHGPEARLPVTAHSTQYSPSPSRMPRSSPTMLMIGRLVFWKSAGSLPVR